MSNEKACGGLDDDLKMYCVPKQYSCPITKILISNSTTAPPEYTEQKKINGSLFLHIARETDNYPISESKIQEGDGVCNNGEINISPDRKDYVLMDPKRQACPADTDPRYIKFSPHIAESELFLINDLFFNLQIKLPQYRLSPYYYYSNFFRGYIGLNYNCRTIIKNFFE